MFHFNDILRNILHLTNKILQKNLLKIQFIFNNYLLLDKRYSRGYSLTSFGFPINQFFELTATKPVWPFYSCKTGLDEPVNIAKSGYRKEAEILQFIL